MGFFIFDNPKLLEGHNLWWMSYPKIENRKIKPKPFGPPPKYSVGDKIRFTIKKRERTREILKVEWHSHRYEWVYVVETSATDLGKDFEPYWFEDKLEYVDA